MVERERAIEPVVCKDLAGAEHRFLLTASALRRIVRRLRKTEISDPQAGPDVLKIEAIYATAWESRMDKTEEDEETFFDRFSIEDLRDIVKRVQAEHQPSDPPGPLPVAEMGQLQETAAAAGSNSGAIG